MQSELRSTDIALPSNELLRKANVTLDILSVLWMREEFNDYDWWLYINPDGSPQLGWYWLVMREDSFRFNLREFTDESMQAHADMNKAYSTRMCLLSCVGRGRGTTIGKSYKMSAIHKMESKDDAMDERKRRSVYGLTADQGVERMRRR